MTEEPAGASLASPAFSPGAPRLVLIPRQAGPIRPLRAGADGPTDELDALVDDVFGPTTDERPGAFDIVLLAAGAILLGWALLTGAAGWVVVVAAGAIALGAALPVRSLVRRYRGAATSMRLRSASRRGYLLDATSASTRGLVRAHEALLEAAALPGSVYAERAVEASHLALVEVATLLDGAAPEGRTQEEYIAKRARAIEALASRLVEAHRRRREAERADEAAEVDRRRRRVAAVTEARDELQAEDRFGSLAQLDRLTTRLAREADDGDR